MKNLVRVSFLFIAMTLFVNLFTSCKKDTNLPTPEPEVIEQQGTTTTGVVNSDVSKMMSLGSMMNTDSTDYCGCFDIFDGVNWDGTEAEIIAQLETILANLTEDELEELFTPVCTDDGEVYENACVAECNGATNYEECDDEYEEEDWTECFAFQYPMTVVFPDGNTQSVNDDEELITAIENWYDANPNSDDDPTLAYPVNVLLEDSTSVAINSDDELEALFDDCYEHDFEDCFTMVFPISLQFPDGTIVAVNSLDEGETVVEDWYDANPDSQEDVELVFPIQIIHDDGTEETVNDEEQLDDLFDECYDDMGGCLIFDDSANALTKGTAKMKKANSNN